jgi:N-acetylneuraminic acid mutarotase
LTKSEDQVILYNNMSYDHLMKTHSTHHPGTWQSQSPLTTARSHPATAVYQNKIYVFGGGGPAFKSLNTVEVYDPVCDEWSTGKEMPTLRSGAMAITVGDKIYVIGGGFKKPDGKFKFLPTVEIYDPGTNTWEKGPDMLQPHDYPAAALLDRYIYIIGGHHPAATEGGPQTDPGFSFCERFNPAGPDWEELAPLPTPRFAASAVVHGGRILTLGGVAFTPQGFKEYDLVEIYDPSGGLWSKSTDLVLPWSVAAHGACIMHNLYLFGGFSGTGGIGTHAAVYDFHLRTWGIVPPLPQPRAAMGVAVVGDTIYLIGGWAADRSVMNSVVAYKPI